MVCAMAALEPCGFHIRANPQRLTRIKYSRHVNYAQLLIPDFSLILCGYLICRYTALNRSVWQPVESLVYYLLFPVLLFQSIVKSPVDIGAASGLIAAGLTMGITGIALAYSLPHWPWLGQHIFARELVRNPLIVATVSGLVANLLGFQIPEWASPTVSRISAASLALGLMAAGAGLQFGLLSRGKALSVAVLSIRHLVQPLLAFAMARLFGLNAVQTTMLLAFSALPTASTCYVLAARMGYNGPYVAGLVTLSTLLGMVSLPFALGFLR